MSIFNKIFNKKKNKVHFYVVRDNCGRLILWLGKPRRDMLSKLWYGYNEITWITTIDNIRVYNLNPKDFDNLKWEDAGRVLARNAETSAFWVGNYSSCE